MDHMDFLTTVVTEDVEELNRKEETYQGSWKLRGGVGAFMMTARKWDRLESMLKGPPYYYDIFAAVSDDGSGMDGTVLAEVRDLRRYLTLIEAEMIAVGNISLQPSEPLYIGPGTPEDGGHHDNTAPGYFISGEKYSQLSDETRVLYERMGQIGWRLREFVQWAEWRRAPQHLRSMYIHREQSGTVHLDRRRIDPDGVKELDHWPVEMNSTEMEGVPQEIAYMWQQDLITHKWEMSQLWREHWSRQ